MRRRLLATLESRLAPTRHLSTVAYPAVRFCTFPIPTRVYLASSHHCRRRWATSLIASRNPGDGSDYATAYQIDDETRQARQSTTELVLDPSACPEGSMSADLIDRAEHALDLWVWERTKEGYQNALSLLERLVQEQETSYDRENPYRLRTYLLNRVVDCWRHCWNEDLLDVSPMDILQLVEGYELREVDLDSRTFTMIIGGMMTKGDALEASLMAQWLLDRRLEAAEVRQDDRLIPDAMFFTAVMNAWARSGRIEAPEMAEGLLEFMQTLKMDGNINSAPTTHSYAALLTAWSQSGHPSRFRKMNDILKFMAEGVDPVLPDRVCYEIVLKAWLNENDADAIQNAALLLQDIYESYQGGNKNALPSNTIYSKVLRALDERGILAAKQRVMAQLESLREYEELFGLTTSSKVASCISRGELYEAETLLSSLETAVQNTDAGSEGLAPPSLYFALLSAWTKRRNPKKAEQVLRHMLLLGSMGFASHLPDAAAFLYVMRCWSERIHKERTVTRINNLVEICVRKYEETGAEALKPSTSLFDHAITAWCRAPRKDGLRRATLLLATQDALFRDWNDPSIKPSRGAITSIISLAAQRGGEEGAQVCDELTTMFHRYESLGFEDMRPDARFYTAVINAYQSLRRGSHARRLADKMLADLDSGFSLVVPDLRLLNAVLQAEASRSDGNAGPRSDEVLRRLTKFHELGKGEDIKLNEWSYDSLLKAWSRTDLVEAPLRAQSILKQLEDSDLSPLTTSYCYAIDAWTKSKDEMASFHSAELLENLLEGLSRERVQFPSYKAYRMFLKCIASSKIQGWNTQAAQLLQSHKKGVVPPQLLPDLP